MRVDCKFIAPFTDLSGYAATARNRLTALNQVGVNVVTENRSFMQEKADDESVALALSLSKKQTDYKVRLMELTPELYQHNLEPCKYHIGRFYWEVVGIDPIWIWNCNKIDEVWATSPYFADMFHNLGIKRPIFIVPQSIDTDLPNYQPLSEPKCEGFVFYSIFQWHERKNPRGLITTYWRTFEGCDDVTLLVKTYRANFSKEETLKIQKDINSWMSIQKQRHYPKLIILPEAMTKQEIMQLHAIGDCFVSPHFGEGWGMSQHTAMSMGKPIISTGFGGIHEWITEREAWFIPYSLVPVWGMENMRWYDNSMFWAEPRLDIFAKLMWDAYSDQVMTKEKGKIAQAFVKENLNHTKVGNLMKERLERLA